MRLKITCTDNFNLQTINETCTLPHVICLINDNYLCACDSKSIYLIDENLKIVKTMCLIETLEKTLNSQNPGDRLKTRNGNMSNNDLTINSLNPNMYSCVSTSSIGSNGSQLINSLNLKLKVKAICYDWYDTQIYLLISIHNQHCLLNVFKMEFTHKTNIVINLKNRPYRHTQQQLEHTVKKIHSFNLYLKNTIHLPIINPIGSKSMACSQRYFFVSEKDTMFVRVMDKENGKYMFSIKSSMTSSTTSEYKKNLNIDEDETLKIQDICVNQRNGLLYVAFSYSIEVFNEKGEFLWKHCFLNELNRQLPTINGKIIRMSLSRNGTLAFVTQQGSNVTDFKNTCYTYA